MTPDRDGGVTLMVALPVSRSIPIGAPRPGEGLTTSIFCRSHSSRQVFQARLKDLEEAHF
jgi:hypothetical protein